MTAINSTSYLGYLNKVVDECNNSYYRSVGKNTIDGEYSALTEEIKANPKAPKFSDRVRIRRHKNMFPKGYT